MYRVGRAGGGVFTIFGVEPMDLGAACRYIFIAGPLLKIDHLFHARFPSQALAHRLHYHWFD